MSVSFMHKITKQPKWSEECDAKMKRIIKSKADQVPEVKAKLLSTGDNIIAEAVVSDTYWSCGLSKEAAANTDPAHWPGKNRLGQLWMEVRDEYYNEENKKQGFNIVEKNRKHGQNTTAEKRKLSDESSSGGNASSKNRNNGTTPTKV